MTESGPPASPSRPTDATSGGERTVDYWSDPHIDVGTYAADALEAPERAEFRAHLESCATCRREVAEFGEATADLALLTAARPPDGLRSATLAAIRGVRPLPPLSPPPAPRRSVPPPPPEHVAPLDDHPSIMPWSLDLGTRTEVVETSTPAPLVNKMLLAIAVVAVVISLAFGGWHAYWTQHRAAEVAAANADTDQRVALLSAPDARLIASTLDGAPVSYVVSKQQDRALFIGDQVPAPGPGRVYQLWLISGDEAVSAGVLDAGGTVQRWLSGPVAEADQVAVTLEPAPAGSSAPTQTPISRERV